MAPARNKPARSGAPNRLRFPLLNFMELQAVAASLSTKLVGARVDRVFVPALIEHPNGYFKQEWCIEFYSAEHSGQLFISLRPQACGVFFLPAKTLKAAGSATRSGFDLGLVKHLEGLKLNSVKTIPNERAVELDFGTPSNSKTLLLILIPSQPEAFLLADQQILNRSHEKDNFVYPTARTLSPEAMNKFSVSTDYGHELECYPTLFMNCRMQAALALRHGIIEKALEERLAYWMKKKDSFEEQLSKKNEGADWSYYGALLQSQLYSKPKLEKGFYSLMDYEKGLEVKIPGDSKLGLKQQLEYYFHQAKRSKTRQFEALSRKTAAEEKIAENESLLKLLNQESLSGLKEIEEKLGLSAKTARPNKGVSTFGGKQFASQEGLVILVGRNKVENAELTFKIAKGNDLWMHVKGRPGAHVVVIIPPKKSASLDTLLDAAHLCIHYSGGKEWGKTEVDYTYKKLVKKIKGQTEVTYTGNKTLMISPDLIRMKRLLGTE